MKLITTNIKILMQDVCVKFVPNKTDALSVINSLSLSLTVYCKKYRKFKKKLILPSKNCNEAAISHRRAKTIDAARAAKKKLFFYSCYSSLFSPRSSRKSRSTLWLFSFFPLFTFNFFYIIIISSAIFERASVRHTASSDFIEDTRTK